MSDHDDFAFEPVRGLPEQLPKGEHLLWQGAPDWKALARRVFRLRLLAVYFAGLLAWNVTAVLTEGAGGIETALWPVPVAAAALAVMALFAWGIGRTTVYTVTNRRVVMRFGMALPITINLPYRAIEAAQVRLHADGTGDIPIQLRGTARVAFLVMWPHVRPWRVARAEPMLRSVPDAVRVAGMMAEAMVAANVSKAVSLPAVSLEPSRDQQLTAAAA